MTEIHADALEVLAFWFEDHGDGDWWDRSDAFDQAVRDRFAETLERARRSELWQWRRTPKGRLAEIIVLDQFSRQLFRDQSEAFALDPLALALAQELVGREPFDDFSVDERAFALIPFMHSESMTVQDEGVSLFERWTSDHYAGFARAHRDVVARFGRFPMRNAALGRASTEEERRYVEENEKAF